jgi:hypothetical protein
MNIVIVIQSALISLGQFKDFFIDNESEYGDAPYYTEIRWLSSGWMIKGVYDF